MLLDRRLCVAPMMDCTDRHARYLLRLISRRTLLYTEMITAAALANGDPRRLLAYDPFEHPVALQVGGSEPIAMADSARLAEDFGYDEININVGCPSDRVKSGAFGACLMAEPETVAACVRAMKAVVSIPVTVKTRIGIDDLDSHEHLLRFADEVTDAGCDALIVHARKAWLSGLSPKENREIPPLDHQRVAWLKRERPGLEIIINGGIDSLDAAVMHLDSVDGCMLGRAPYRNPWMLARADEIIHGETRGPMDRHDLVRAYLPYIESRLAEGTALRHITRHMAGLFQGRPGARAWRRALTEGAGAGGGAEVVENALSLVSPDESVRISMEAAG